MWTDRADEAQGGSRRPSLRSLPLVEGERGPSGGLKGAGTAKNGAERSKVSAPSRFGIAGYPASQRKPTRKRFHAIASPLIDGVESPKRRGYEVRRQIRNSKSAGGVSFHHHFRRVGAVGVRFSRGASDRRTTVNSNFRNSSIIGEKAGSWFLVKNILTSTP